MIQKLIDIQLLITGKNRYDNWKIFLSFSTYFMSNEFLEIQAFSQSYVERICLSSKIKINF